MLSEVTVMTYSENLCSYTDVVAISLLSANFHYFYHFVLSHIIEDAYLKAGIISG